MDPYTPQSSPLDPPQGTLQSSPLDPPRGTLQSPFPAGYPGPRPEEPPTPSRRRWVLPLILYLATIATTFLMIGPAYSLSLMTILTAHELGHYFQARRYGVPASLPFFIPLPLPPIGTLGAVILMRKQSARRRALFDVAITGPIAGLLPALAMSYAGLRMSEVTAVDEVQGLKLGEPLLFKLLSYLAIGPVPEGYDVLLHPIAYAGWVGFFITALNLIPIGQLDGGHILYSLLPGRAHLLSAGLFAAAITAVAVGGYWQWTLMLVLLALVGVRHPPMAEGGAPLGGVRVVLGWLMLLFVLVGFTPTPFDLSSLP